MEAGKIYFVQVIPIATSKNANGQGQGDVKLMISGPIVQPTATPRVTSTPGSDWDDEYGNNVITPTPTNSPVASATPGVDD